MAKASVSELKALAQKCSLQGKRTQAAETYLLLGKEEPSNPRWPQKAGEEFRTVGLRDRAVTAFTAAAKLYVDQGLTLRALTLCKLVLDLDKDNRPAHQMLASFAAPPPAAAPLASHPAATGLLEHPESRELSPRAAPPAQEARTVKTPDVPEPPELIELSELPELPVAPPPRRPPQPAAPSRHYQVIEAPEPVTESVPAELPPPVERSVPQGQPVSSGKIGVEALTDLLNLRDLPEWRMPASFSISIPRGEALGAIGLGAALTEGGPQQGSGFDAVEISIDEPESAIQTRPSAPPAVSARQEILTRMPPIPIFSSLGPSALRALVERVEVRTFAPRARLITQGEEGDSLFVLVDGEVAVFHEGTPRVELTHLKEGAFFGEISLITKAPRTATVEAVRESEVLEISREVFNELVHGYPDMVKVLLRYLRERLVKGLVATHPLFTPFRGSERTMLVRRFSLLEAAKGCVLMDEGVRASGLFIMLCGKAESRRGGALRKELSSGDVFGVESLLTGQPSPVSVRTLTRSWILKMREDAFREVILTFPPVLAVLSDMIAAENRRTQAAVAGGTFEQVGIPLF